MGAEKILLKVAKLLILFSIIYLLWIMVLGPLLQPTQWYIAFNQTYYKALRNTKIRVNNSLIKGEELYLQDVNANISVMSDGLVYANVSSYTNDRDLMLIYFYNRLGWKYMCINSIFLNRRVCKDDYYNFSRQYLDAINTTMGMSLPSQEQQNITFAIPMNINNHGGVVTSYIYTANPSDDYLSHMLDTNPDGVYQITDYYETYTAVIDFKETTTKCLRFAIPRSGRVRINVTMPAPIITSTVPEQFLNNSIAGSNYVYVDYNPYPCCGIPKLDRVEVEVCS